MALEKKGMARPIVKLAGETLVHMLRLWLVVGKVVPSLGSGGGNTLTRG